PGRNGAGTVAGGNGSERCQFTTQGFRLFWRDCTCGIASAQTKQGYADQAAVGDFGAFYCCFGSHRVSYRVQALEVQNSGVKRDADILGNWSQGLTPVASFGLRPIQSLVSFGYQNLGLCLRVWNEGRNANADGDL